MADADLLRAAERSGLIFFSYDEGPRRLVLSESSRPLLGYTSQEIVTDPTALLRLVGREGIAALEAATQNVREAGSDRAQAVLPAQARDGRSLWLSCTIFGVRDGAGKVTGWEGVAMDATELVRSRRAAEEAREVFRVMFDEGPLAAVLWDPKTLAIRRANARAAEMFGTPRGDLEGAFISEFIPPSEWPRIQDHVAKAAQSKGVAYLQRTVCRKADGTVFPVQAADVGFEVEGKFSRLSVFRDLTDIEAAKEQVKLIFRVIEASPTPMVVCDHTLAITHANPSLLAIVGRAAEDVVGREIGSLFDPATGARLNEQKEGLKEARPLQGEGALKTKGGGLEPISYTITPAPDAEGTVRLFFGSFRAPQGSGAGPGQTPAEAALFFDLLAHDSANYLTAVRGYIELMVASGGLPAPSVRMAEIARAQATNALDLIRDTRKIVSLQRDPSQSRATGDLTAIIDDAGARVEPILAERKFRVRKEYGAGAATVRSPDLLREVFVNLLHNAVKFDAHDEVLLDILVEKSSLRGSPAFSVRVSDRGVGIADGDKRHLFERGFRPSNAPARRSDAIAPPGSGIGLSLCKFIVERAGGEVSAENRIPGDPSQGTAFVIRLPSA